MPRHILIKLTKTKHKERILKAAREKQQITYKGNHRREWQDIFKVIIDIFVPIAIFFKLFGVDFVDLFFLYFLTI